MARTPEQLQAELMDVYGKQNTPRLKRKAFYLERARYNEEARNNEVPIPPHRNAYFSHRLHVLQTLLEGRGVDLDELDFYPPDRYNYRGNMRRKRRNGWSDEPITGCWSIWSVD